MRKIVFFLMSFTLLFFLGTTTFAASNTMDIDTSESDRGIVKVKFNTGTEKKIKLLVQHNDNKYYYNLSNDESYVNFPLQFGNGEYTVSIFENTSASKYRKLYSESFDVAIKDENAVYLNSIQEIEWDDSYKAIKLADQMVDEASPNELATNKGITSVTEEEVVDLMYDFVVENISYDYQKISQLEYNYLPNIDSTLETKTGICYDYSSLFASMLRSQGVPTKLVKGYTSWTSVYHAWNEVYIASEDRWIVVDTTYDAYLYIKNRSFSFEKDETVYSKKKEF